MNVVVNLGKVKWLWLLIVITIFAAAFGVSAFLGRTAANSCLLAILVSAIAGCGGAVPIIYALLFKPSLAIACGLAASVIRLLLVATGTIIILLFVKPSVLWFVVWLCLFYAVMLALEICFFVRTMNRHNEIKA